jgi:hypothetical protein
MGFVRDVPLDGPYRLIAVDLPEDMALYRCYGTRRDCGLVGPEPSVFQAGANDKFIVLARHPRRWPDDADRSVTEFYYVVRLANEADSVTYPAVVGPLDKLQYHRESERLGLPEFTKVVEDLK